MKVSYSEGLATHAGPESCAVVREDGGEALTGVRAGWVLSREIYAPPRAGYFGVPTPWRKRKATPDVSIRRDAADPARSETPCMYGNTLHGNREIPRCLRPQVLQSASGSPRTYADDERAREVGPPRST